MKELVIELTNRCRNACLHCSSYPGESASPEDLQVGQVLRLVRELKLLGFEQVVLSGGEPVIYPDFLKLIAGIRSIGSRLKMYTSGVFEDWMYDCQQYLDAFRLFDVIALSCHSVRKDTHNHIVQNEYGFQNFKRAMRIFKKLGVQVEVNFVPMMLNLADMAELDRFFCDTGITKINILMLTKQGSAIRNWNKLEVNGRELKAYLDGLCSQSRIKIGRPFAVDPSQPCSAGHDKVCVSYDGYVLPCEVFKKDKKVFPNLNRLMPDHLRDLLTIYLGLKVATATESPGCLSNRIVNSLSMRGVLP